MALGSQSVAQQLATNRLWGGFKMALAGFVLDFIIHHSSFIIPPEWTSSFIILPSAFLWRSGPTLVQAR